MKKNAEKRIRCFLVMVVFAWGMTGQVFADLPPKPEPVKEIRPGLLMGYLPSRSMMETIIELVPPPPAEGSAAYKLDQEKNKDALALRGSARWKQAAVDAVLKFPQAAGVFSCAINAPITEEQTPYLYQLLRRVVADAGLSTYGAKGKYKRPRPFLVNQQPICTPEQQEKLKHNGSYPSGHTAVGWAWALILTEVAPDRAEQILARGRSFGESRAICNVHWQSDIIEGRFAASATVARLHADPIFKRDLEAAKKEYAAIVAKGLKPTRDCQAENKSFASDQ